MKENLLKMVAAILVVMGLSASAFANGQADGKAPASSTGPVTIDLWYGAAVTEAGPPPADWKVLSLIKSKLNIDLKLMAEPSAIEDQNVKVNAAGASNSLPDIFMVNRDVWAKLVQQGLVAPVDDLYDDAEPHEGTV
jgi:putative aldouronate transport system substrate-binding protein